MIFNWKCFLIPYEQAVEELKIKFRSIRNEFKKMDEYSPIEFVTGRVKQISSILEKCDRMMLPLDRVEELEDIAGIRIMCQLVDDIETVVNLIRDRDGKDLEIMYEKDYITNLKESGYRSYHMIIKYTVQTAIGEREILVELQIRTLAMNFWATIEHSLNYKFNENLPEDIRQRLKNASEAAFLLDKEMSKIKDEIMDSQGLFHKRSTSVEEVLNRIQDLYLLQMSHDQLELIRKRFWDIKRSKDFDAMNKLKEELDELIKIKREEFENSK
ncbi:MAG: GTP pyrophosphokinase family protein [Andreesenia angusta]|nr:GTP pyrophosphokinase family protein [Andreesenia angusta]